MVLTISSMKWKIINYYELVLRIRERCGSLKYKFQFAKNSRVE